MATVLIKDENEKEIIDASNEPNDLSELTNGIKLAQEALDLFLNNHYEDAKKILEAYSGSQIYPSLGYATVMYMQAAITMESQQIDDASNAVKICLGICQKSRRKVTFSESLKIKNKSSDFAKYTDYQCHAELCYAECLLQKAFLTFVQDENLLALIKGSLKIRECYRTYKDCWNILKVKEWKNEFIKSSFESGVRLGVGAFNLMISMLPSRILKLLEFVGFKGNQTFGICEMNKAASSQNNLRQPLASLMLLSYHCFVGVIVGMYPYNDHINEAEKLIAPCSVKYESSALFGMLRARIDLMCGKFEEGIIEYALPSEHCLRRILNKLPASQILKCYLFFDFGNEAPRKAIVGYENAITSQNEWKNLHDICHWELLWCYVLQKDWLLGMKYAEKLSQHSRWSKATYLYQKAVFLIECYAESSETVNDDMKAHIRKIFESIPKLMQRFAGKSLPIEKFAAKKSKRYFEQNENLVLPGVELIFVWNGFKMMAYNSLYVEKFLQLCDETLQNLEKTTTAKSYYYFDNIALATLLKAVCHRYLNHIPEAVDLMKSVLKLNKKVKEDLYIMPFTEVELAQIAFSDGRYEDVKTHINNAKSYKGYSLESRLHFRMHGINISLNKALSVKNSVSENSWDQLSFEELPNNNHLNGDNELFHDCISESSDKISLPSSP